MKFIIGKKIEMSQKFRDDGVVIPVTVIAAGPCWVSRIRNKDKNGYDAIQVAFGEKKRIKRSLEGQVKHIAKKPEILHEFRKHPSDHALNLSMIPEGGKITVATFSPGDRVTVTGISKGKGFQGVVKRHGFGGSPKTHGHKDQLRMPGSIGATDPQHVFKGTRMAGRMGGDKVTIFNLEVVDIDKERNLIFIKGAVPGARGGLLTLVGEGELFIENEEKGDQMEEKKNEEKSDDIQEEKKEENPQL